MILADDLTHALSTSVALLSKIEGEEWGSSFSPSSTLSEVTKAALTSHLNLDQVLAGAALRLAKLRLKVPDRKRRSSLEFVTSELRPVAQRLFVPKASADWALDPAIVLKAVLASNLTIELIHDLALANNVPLFVLLGMRNLSSLVGELFAREIQTLMPTQLMANPNQDGYPDLCARTKEGQEYIELHNSEQEKSDKQYWSPYPQGGLEVKSTCGNTPSAKKMAKLGIGDSRHPILESAEWKAHHRTTNNLIGVYWDFIDGLPTVLAVFFRNDLSEDDWGKIALPKEGGGKTTSVSIMKRTGVKKMAAGWLVLPIDDAISTRILHSKVFALKYEDIKKLIKGDVTK